MSKNTGPQAPTSGQPAGAPAAQQQSQQETNGKPQDKGPMEKLQDLFVKWRPTLNKVLPRGVDAERVIRIAMNVYMNKPELHACTLLSMVRATIQCAELGLEPSPLLQECAFIPYENTKRIKQQDGNIVTVREMKVLEVQCQPMYLGLIKIAKQGGGIKDIYAVPVLDSEKVPVFDQEGRLESGFYVQQGTVRQIEHIQRCAPSGDLHAVYGVVKMTDGCDHFEVLWKPDVDRHRSFSKAKNASAWTDHYVEMAKKTAIRQALKMVPKSPEKPLAKALAIDTQTDVGEAFSSELASAIEAEGVSVVDDLPALPMPTQTAAEALGTQPTRTEQLATKLEAKGQASGQQTIMHDPLTGEIKS